MHVPACLLRCDTHRIFDDQQLSVYRGACQCGAVRFTVHAPARPSVLRYTDAQGAGPQDVLVVPADALQVQQGQELLQAVRLPDTVLPDGEEVLQRCAACGSCVWCAPCRWGHALVAVAAPLLVSDDERAVVVLRYDLVSKSWRAVLQAAVDARGGSTARYPRLTAQDESAAGGPVLAAAQAGQRIIAEAAATAHAVHTHTHAAATGPPARIVAAAAATNPGPAQPAHAHRASSTPRLPDSDSDSEVSEPPVIAPVRLVASRPVSEFMKRDTAPVAAARAARGGRTGHENWMHAQQLMPDMYTGQDLPPQVWPAAAAAAAAPAPARATPASAASMHMPARNIVAALGRHVPGQGVTANSRLFASAGTPGDLPTEVGPSIQRLSKYDYFERMAPLGALSARRGSPGTSKPHTRTSGGTPEHARAPGGPALSPGVELSPFQPVVYDAMTLQPHVVGGPPNARGANSDGRLTARERLASAFRSRANAPATPATQQRVPTYPSSADHVVNLEQRFSAAVRSPDRSSLWASQYMRADQHDDDARTVETAGSGSTLGVHDGVVLGGSVGRRGVAGSRIRGGVELGVASSHAGGPGGSSRGRAAAPSHARAASAAAAMPPARPRHAAPSTPAARSSASPPAETAQPVPTPQARSIRPRQALPRALRSTSANVDAASVASSSAPHSTQRPGSVDTAAMVDGGMSPVNRVMSSLSTRDGASPLPMSAGRTPSPVTQTQALPARRTAAAHAAAQAAAARVAAEQVQRQQSVEVARANQAGIIAKQPGAARLPAKPKALGPDRGSLQAAHSGSSRTPSGSAHDDDSSPQATAEPGSGSASSMASEQAATSSDAGQLPDDADQSLDAPSSPSVPANAAAQRGAGGSAPAPAMQPAGVSKQRKPRRLRRRAA